MTPEEFLRTAPIGMRVVVRHCSTTAGRPMRSDTCARARTPNVEVETKRGRETVLLATVIAAKEVPPPPAPRSRRPGV